MPPANDYVKDPKEWGKKRSVITHLYIDSDYTLGKVIETMTKQYKFRATEAQYKRRFSAWKLRKNRNLRDRTKSIGEGERHLSKDHKEIALCWENTQTDIHNQPTQVPIGVPWGFGCGSAPISGIDLPDHLGTGLFEIDPVQGISGCFSESDTSTIASASLWSIDDSNIGEQSRTNAGVFAYNSPDKSEVNQKPSNIVSEEMEKSRLSPTAKADIAFHEASEAHHREITKFTPQVSVRLSREEWLAGETCLHRSAYFGYEDTVHLILKMGFSTNISSKGSDGETALHWAVLGGHRKVARLLLEEGIDLSQNRYGETALHLAACYGRAEIARLILSQNINLSLQDLNGETALHLAARYGHEEIAYLILSQYIDLSLRDSNGETAREVALRCNHSEIADLIQYWGGFYSFIYTPYMQLGGYEAVPHDNPPDPTFNTRINTTLERTTHQAPSNRGPYDVLPPPQYKLVLPGLMR